MLLSPDQDPMGAAILDYHQSGSAAPLVVRSSMFFDDEMSVAHLFRTEAQMPPLERTALSLAHGHVLDVGAGAGCHSLALQARGLRVTSIDVSPLSVRVMQERGLRDVRHACYFDSPPAERFDCVLFLMNGLGIAGALTELPQLFSRLDALLTPEGFALTDSCDLAPILMDDDGQLPPEATADGAYYGEVDYTLHYRALSGPPFHWLYVDADRLAQAAQQSGFHCEVLRRGAENDFLVRLSRA